MYSQLGAVHSHMRRGLNGDLGRPISINLDAPDGNVPNRMRSMSELPNKFQKKKLSDMSVRLFLSGTCETRRKFGKVFDKVLWRTKWYYVAQCYDKTWATLVQSKIKKSQYC